MPCSDIPLSGQMPFCSLSSHHSLPLLIPHGWYHSRKIIKPGCLVSWCMLPHCCSTRLTLICRRCPHSLGGLLPASNYPTFLTPQPFYAHFIFAGTFVGHNFLLPIKISLYFSFSSLLLYWSWVLKVQSLCTLIQKRPPHTFLASLLCPTPLHHFTLACPASRYHLYLKDTNALTLTSFSYRSLPYSSLNVSQGSTCLSLYTYDNVVT